MRLTLALGVVFTCAASAQVSLRAGVDLVLVPVTVTDRSGRVMSDLEQTGFRVFEDGVARTIASFSNIEAPVSVGLVLDISGSMKEKLAKAQSAIAAIVASLNPGDEALLLTCSDNPGLQAGFTTDLGVLERLLARERPGGRTALIDTVMLALHRMKAARHPRRALAIVSDGQDNHSRFSREELMSRALESDTQVYSIAVFDPDVTLKPIQLTEENNGFRLLADLAGQTGGLVFRVASPGQIAPAAERIGFALHQQYLIGFYPAEAGRGGWHKIQVKLNVPNTRLYTRNRYFAGEESGER